MVSSCRWLCFLLLHGLLQSAVALKVVSNPSTLEYHIVSGDENKKDGTTLFRGGDFAFFVDGKWCVHQISTLSSFLDSSAPSFRRLVPKNIQAINGTDETLGKFTGEQVYWLCLQDDEDDELTRNELPIVTSFKNMDSGAAVVFDVTWPDGAPNTTVAGSYKSSLANYPSLHVDETLLPNALSWEGSFTQSLRGFSKGTLGGPTVFYNAKDSNFKTVIMASPWNGHWKAFSAGNNQNWAGDKAWSPGTSGRIAMLPKGYHQSILMHQRNDGQRGITATMSSWGDIMQHSRKPRRGPFKIPDITLEKIGYQTDNGAMYCFCSDKNCSQTLLDEIEYLKNEEIPVGYLSFQGAGASSGRGQAAPWCIDTWGVDGGLGKQYPMDLKSFQKALGLPLQLYAPYFCPGSEYFDSSDHPSEWKSVSSDTTLPGCKDFAFENIQSFQSRHFYNWFLKKGIDNADMVSFETDFMDHNTNCVPEFINTATGAETWQQGMTGAALAKKIPIQWCYAAPTDVLASLDMPAVTNFRVSFDFCYGKSYAIGESSLLVWAVGGAPSKDTLWSTDNNKTAIPGCPWTPDHEEPAAELHVVLALMSTGPVGISDAIGYTNATLLKRIIRQDGTLLKPLKPITSIDSTFLDSARPLFALPAASSEDDGGYIYGTNGLGPSWHFVSFLLPEAYTVRLQDFWPSVPRTTGQSSILAYRQFGSGLGCENDVDAVESGCVKLIELSSTDDSSRGIFKVPPSPDASSGQSRYIPTITSVWQSCPKSRWILLGELDKYVPISQERFQQVECTDLAISITVIGVHGEEVEVTALRPPSSQSQGDLQYTVVKQNVKLLQGQMATLSFVDPIEQEVEIGRE